jgi:hypothetical protein
METTVYSVERRGWRGGGGTLWVVGTAYFRVSLWVHNNGTSNVSSPKTNTTVSLWLLHNNKI